MLKQGFQEDI
jgi:ATP-dependent RNA helicase DDX21